VEVTRPSQEVTRIVTVTAPVTATPVAKEQTAVTSIPYQGQWSASAHANAGAPAFTHWHNDNPAEIPAACAQCHSNAGFLDFMGADGSEAGVVNQPAPIGSVVTCETCHNPATLTLDSAAFPAGITLHGLGVSARCIVCHQGRASTVQVNNAITDAGLDAVTDADTVSPDLAFTNVHYAAAAVSLLGTEVQGGYEYDGQRYDPRFDHVAPLNECVACHDPHTLQIDVATCAECHTEVQQPEDLHDIRLAGSLVDYNGNGHITEPISAELAGLQETLYQAMRAYAQEVSGVPLAYGDRHPYFFVDENDNGVADEEENGRYNAWTPRLSKAAYNYQVVLTDSGGYVHGGKYLIQLLYDSLADLNQALSKPIDMSAMNRDDHGHFAASAAAFRHWDEAGMVPGSCSKCHTAAGLPFFLEQGVNINQAPSGGLNCATCHTDLSTFTRFTNESVTFPSGASLSLTAVDEKYGTDSNLCLHCHQGVESTRSVNSAIGNLLDDEVSPALRFQNIHYFAAGASLFGTEAQGGYEYAGQTYVGRYEHVTDADTCLECHKAHDPAIQPESCGACHRGVKTADDLLAIRQSNTDFDGDGVVTEGINGEIETMRERLLQGIQLYAATQPNTDNIFYDPHNYPYFINEEGQGYNTWTPRLLRAAYNYQFAAKDPGGYTHNGAYIMQLLYDSLQDVGIGTAGMIRPE